MPMAISTRDQAMIIYLRLIFTLGTFIEGYTKVIKYFNTEGI